MLDQGSRVIAALLMAAASLVSTGAGAQGVEIEGVKLEPTVEAGDAPLQLNGAGVRTRFVFKVYVAGLYLPQKATDTNAVLAQKGPKRVAITMLRNVDADTFSGALLDGLRDNHTEAQFAALKPQIDMLTANFKVAGEAKKGDVVHLDFVPGSGTRVVVNGQARGTTIAGDDFFNSLLRIWIGAKPVEPGLKKALLGG